MEKTKLHELLKKIEKGELSADEAMKDMRSSWVSDLGYATIDHHRSLRQGTVEVVFAQKKTPDQIVGIVKAMEDQGERDILITRLSPEKFSLIKDEIKINYDEISGIGICGKKKAPDGIGYILVVSAGTSDMPVCEEAAITAEFLGNEVKRLYDVGVAGIHRLLSKEDMIAQASVIIAVAGMEGALASVVGGLASVPVIAVPTSVGYGASFGGVSALLSMLNSCASGVTVVNIDNGFGAGFSASMINHMGMTL